MSEIYLTILIPSIPERVNQLNKLHKRLNNQINELPVQNEIEIIALIDNKVITIGEKRERLKNMANGKYFCFLDDDDDISDDYVLELWGACKDNDVDVICFDTWASVDGDIGTIKVSVKHPENEQFKIGEPTLRKPSHVNAWKTEKFKQYQFSDSMYGEDFDFCNQCYPHITTSHRIDKILHYYTYDKGITQAFEKPKI